MTKSSDLDKLHTQFTKALAEGLKGEIDSNGHRLPPSPALHSVVGAFLYRSGTKATDDSPTMRNLARAYESLPFTTADTPTATANDTSEKVSH
jgi:hypothetical protein